MFRNIAIVLTVFILNSVLMGARECVTGVILRAVLAGLCAGSVVVAIHCMKKS